MDKDEAVRTLRDVIEVLQSADIPKELWPTAFGQVWSEMKTGGPTEPPQEGARGVEANGGSPYDELAKRVGVEATLLQDIYTEEDGILAASPPARMVAVPKTNGTIELALLACAGREASGLQDTPSSVIRDLASHYAKFDSSNFAATMLSGDAFWQISGKGQQRNYRLRMPGWDRAGEVIRRVAGLE